MEQFESKLLGIAEKYADLVEKQLDTALSKETTDCGEMCGIGESIRTLNHAVATLERANRLLHGNETGGQDWED